VKVAWRLTAATGVFVLAAASVYAFYDVRGRGRERRAAMEREAKVVAAGLQIALEQMPPDVVRNVPAAVTDKLNRSVTGWRVVIVPRSRATDAASNDRDVDRQNRWMLSFIEVPKLAILDDDDDRLYHAVSLHAPVLGQLAQDADTEVVAMLELSRSLDGLRDAGRADFWRAVALILVAATLSTMALAWLAHRAISKPIVKLLRGVDDVAKGDLSHVILAERDDEVGAIATRFNEMTFSLRESRAETLRQNEAKLGLEQRLGHSEKLATIGQLAAEIAHEVGTPLGVIAGRARATAKKSGEPEVVVRNSEIIAEQTARITKIIQRLLDFTRRKVGVPENVKVDLNGVVATTMELLSGQIAAQKIHSSVVLTENQHGCFGDPDRLQQVLLNLALNAVQAMPLGGTLEVATENVSRSRPGLEDAAPQRYVQLEVRDSGPGIADDVRDKIFDPFFTTKERTGGTGLGLAVCIGIVKEHDGWIEVDNRSQGGTIMRVLLPAELSSSRSTGSHQRVEPARPTV
jgi:signal transduction histidine kinase